MNPQRFYIILLSLSAAVAAALIFMHSFADLAPHVLLSWGSYSFFVLFSIAVFSLGRWSAKNKNKLLFSRVFMGATVSKMLLSLSMVMAYFYVVQPDSKLFILPFFLIYICFTIFEVYFMTKLGNYQY